MIDLQPFPPADDATLDALVAIWNAACGGSLPANRRFFAYCVRPSTGAEQSGCLALVDERPAGFVLASAAVATFGDAGWIDALAVAPEYQRQGVGGRLLAWAERWLAARGCHGARPGGSLRAFVPGVPIDAGATAFFERRGYALRQHTWDVARDLGDHDGPATTRVPPADVRPVAPGQEPALLEFLERAFPGRWAYEYREALSEGARPGDFLALWLDGAVEGFCRLTFEDSLRPIERFYPQRLPRPWGQLGPIGVGERCRGQGYGAAVLDAGLRHLRGRGVRGCVIDWTDLVDFYGKFGFAPYRQFALMAKTLV